MEKVVNLKERIRSKRQKEQREQHRGKIEAIQRVAQCSSCSIRCAMCGHHVNVSEASTNSVEHPLRLPFCEHCKGEFNEFLAISRGKRRSDAFWHNKEWVKMWATWLNHRKAINAFVNSMEYKVLADEIDSE